MIERLIDATDRTPRLVALRAAAVLAVSALVAAACTTEERGDGQLIGGAEAIPAVATADGSHPVHAATDVSEPSEPAVDGTDPTHSSQATDATASAVEVSPSTEPAPVADRGTVIDDAGEPVEPPALPAGFAIDGDALQEVTDDGATVTRGDVVVTTDAGAVELVAAAVVEQPNGDVATLATLPLPTSGPLANAVPSALPKGRVGTATGAELASTVPHLNPATTYTYMVFRGDVELDTGIESGPHPMDLLDHVSVFGTEPGLVVIDPDDYFYIGGTCPTGGTADKERSKHDDSTRSGASTLDDIDPVVLALEPTEVAVPCGFGVSNRGTIPAVPELVSETAPLDGMNAHIVVHGAEVVAPGLAVDGTFYFQLLDPGFRLIANGTLLASLSVISGKLGIDLPLGDATLDMGVSSDGLRVRFVAQSPDIEPLPLPIAIEFPAPEGGIRTEGALDFAIAADGTPSIGADSYLQIAGELGVQIGAFGAVTGVALADATVDGLLRLDGSGVTVRGSVGGSFVPGIDIDAGAELEAFVDFDGLTGSHVQVIGNAGIGAIALRGHSGVRVDASGVEAWGLASLPVGDIEVRGSISADGVELNGAARAVVPLGPIADAASAARAELDAAQAEVATIDDEIARIRADIEAGRDANRAGLRQAQADVAAERAKLDGILDTMAYNRSEIRRMQQLQEESWDPFYDFELSLKIGALEVANVAQDGYRVIAQGALDIAIGALDVIEDGLEIIPVDADPRIVALFIAREAAMLVLDGASAVLGLVPDEVRANLEFTIGTSGFFGDAGIDTCTDGSCTTVVSGSIASDPPQLCFVLLGADICVGLGELSIV